MPSLRSLLIAGALCAAGTLGPLAEAQMPAAQGKAEIPSGLVTDFLAAEHYAFTEAEQAGIRQLIEVSHQAVQAEFPDLPDTIRFTITPSDRSMDQVGGSSGRADARDAIAIEISTRYPGGIEAVLSNSLAQTIIHELHHVVRGWTIQNNQFGPGIDIAAVNEGLAVVFSEDLSGQAFPGNAASADAEDWASEIRALPRDANYGEWMFAHPDGREAIGYRTGAYLVRRAMVRSGLSIVELTRRTPDEIWEMSGLDG